jgi:hypothetical protein
MPHVGDDTSGGADKPPEGSIAVGSSLSAIMEDAGDNEKPRRHSESLGLNQTGGGTHHAFHPIHDETGADLVGWQPCRKEKHKAANTSAKSKTMQTPACEGSKRSRRKGKVGSQAAAEADGPAKGKPAVCGQKATLSLNTLGLSQGANGCPASEASVLEINAAGKRGVARLGPLLADEFPFATPTARLPSGNFTPAGNCGLGSMATSRTTIAATADAPPRVALGQSLLLNIRARQSGNLQLTSDTPRNPMSIASSRIPVEPPVQKALPSRILSALPLSDPTPLTVRHDYPEQESGALL